MVQVLDNPITRLRVLHLEDEPTWCNTIKRAFKKLYERVHYKSVNNSFSFEYQMPFVDPQIIIVDWTLKDGEVTDILDFLQENRDIKVIFFSAHNESDLHAKVLRALKFCPQNFSFYDKAAPNAFTDMFEEIENYAKKKHLGKADYCA